MKMFYIFLIGAAVVLSGCSDSDSKSAMQSSENGASTDNGMTTNPTSALAEFAGADATSDSLPISDPEALRSDMQALFGDESADPKKVGDDTTLSDLIQ